MQNSVSQIMKKDNKFLTSKTLVEEALLFMNQLKVRSIPVVDNDEFKGIIRDAELVSVLSLFGNTSNVTISPWITKKINVAKLQMSISEVGNLIVQQQFLCLPVIENNS